LTLGVLAAVAASAPSTNDIEPGVLGFLVVAAMGVALVFLLRSMNKQFRKITPTPDADNGEEAKTPAQTPELTPRVSRVKLSYPLVIVQPGRRRASQRASAMAGMRSEERATREGGA
jgi:hypothetical protein